MDAEITLLLKEALQRISTSPAAERANLTTDFAKRLQEASPETAAMIWQARYDGTFLRKLFEFAVNATLERSDLSVGDKLKAFDDAGEFVDAFHSVVRVHGGPYPLALIFDLACEALLLGLNAGAPPEKIEEARVLGRKDIGRSGGQKNQENRRLKAKEWQAFATQELSRLRQAKPYIKFSSAAKIIAKSWATKFPSKPPIKSETIRAFLGIKGLV